MDISEVTSFDWCVAYLYYLMTELYFGHEIVISFRNIMLRMKIDLLAKL